MKRILVLVLVISISAVFAFAEKIKETIKQTPQATIIQKQAAEKAGLPLEKKVDIGNDANLTVVFIPAGEFEMGSPLEELKRDDDEAQHRIKLTKPFYIGKFEVTQLQYRIIMTDNPSKFGGDNLPVHNVNWYEAARFIKRLSEKTGLKFRFPTEAEWEYACRAGTTTAFNTGETLDSDLANYDGTEAYGTGIAGKELERTSKVGSYPPNAFGLYDMHGNVWEWCGDVYDNEYYKVTPNNDPQGPQHDVEDADRVMRGGAWNEKAHKCRSADRNNRSPKANQPIIGFRVVLEIE